MSACSMGSQHLKSTLLRDLPGFVIEVVDDLHMIGDKADRMHQYALVASGSQIANVIADIWSQPGLSGRSAPTLKNHLIVTARYAKILRDEPGGFV